MGNYIKKFIFLIPLMCVMSTHASQFNQNFIIKFGFFAQGSDLEYEMVEEDVKVVNLLKMNDAYILSVEIVPSDDLEYKLHTIDYLAGEPKILGGILSEKLKSDFAKGIKSQEIKAKGILYSPIVFDEGDPLGEYKMEVFINDKLMKTFKYNVVAE